MKELIRKIIGLMIVIGLITVMPAFAQDADQPADDEIVIEEPVSDDVQDETIPEEEPVEEEPADEEPAE